MQHFIIWQEKNANDKDLLLAINLQPRAAKDEIINIENAPIKIRITAAPIDNKANESLIKFIAKEFGVPQVRVTIEKGEHSRKKLLRINNPKKIPQQILKYLDEHK